MEGAAQRFYTHFIIAHLLREWSKSMDTFHWTSLAMTLPISSPSVLYMPPTLEMAALDLSSPKSE